MGMKYRGLTVLLALTCFAVMISCSNYNSSTAPNPGVTGTGFIFVTTQGDQKISSFTIALSTGIITPNGNGLDTGSLPVASVMTPDGNTIFVANKVSGDISRYTVKSDGTLTAVTPTISTAGTNPVAIAMDAAGKTLVVLNQGNPFSTPQAASSITVFAIGQGAALTPKSTTTIEFTPILPSQDASAIAITPDGKFVYATSLQENLLSGYSIDPTSGALTQVNGSPYTTGTTPSGLVVTPDDPANPSANGIFVYVANADSGNISIFAVCDKVSTACLNSDGTLTEITGSPMPANATELGSMVIINPAVITPPSHTFFYVVDQGANHVLQFTVAPVTGALTALSPADISTGAKPIWVGAKSNGQYVFAANNGGSSFSSYVITDPTNGVLTLAGSATTTTTGGNPSTILVK
jgi:6-phosphogluconolactonase